MKWMNWGVLKKGRSEDTAPSQGAPATGADEQKSALMEKIKAAKKKLSQAERQGRIDRENMADPYWLQAQQERSVRSVYDTYTYFASRTWEMLEEAAREKSVILLGSAAECQYYYDRYGAEGTLAIDPGPESWRSLREYLCSLGLEDKAVLIIRKDWEPLADALTHWQGRRNNLFVYSLMDYDKNEQAMLDATWNDLRADCRDTDLVLVTANKHAKIFIQKIGHEMPVKGVLSAKKNEWGGGTMQHSYKAGLQGGQGLPT